MNERCSAGIDSETLSAWRSRLLTPQEQQSLTTHVADCAACQRILAGFDRIAQVLRTPPRISSQDVIWRGVQASLTSSRGKTMIFPFPKTWAVTGLSTALILVISFAMLFVLHHPQSGNTPPISTATATATSTPTQTLTATATPTQTRTITEYAVPAGITPDHLITGPDGNLWFTDVLQLQIGRMTPSGTVTLFHIPSAQPVCCNTYGRDDITIGPDHNLWFTEGNANKIGRITPNGVVTEYALPGGASHKTTSTPSAITSGPDGNLWFAGTIAIWRMTTQGNVAEFPIPSMITKNGQSVQTTPSAITSGPDGNLWFTESQGDHIGRITPQGNISQFPLPETQTPALDITSGPDGNLWVIYGAQQGHVGRITPNGTITTFSPPALAVFDPLYSHITSGPDGNLWFTNGKGGIGRVTPQGVSTLFTSSSFNQNNLPIAITSGPDGNLWFTESDGKIGRMTP